MQAGELMNPDFEFRQDVVDELRWDPQVPDPEAIGMAVKDGAGAASRQR
jgi:hypothetical protein